MQATRWAALTVTLILAAACGGESEVTVHEDDTSDTDRSDTPIADELKKPMDRAAAVEDLAKSRKEEMDKRLAEMEGETSDDEDP
jgi:hypothetical protein